MNPKLLIRIAAVCIFFFAIEQSIGPTTRPQVTDAPSTGGLQTIPDIRIDSFGQVRSYNDTYSGVSLNLVLTLLATTIVLWVISNFVAENKKRAVKLLIPITLCVFGFSITGFLFLSPVPAVACLAASLLTTVAIIQLSINKDRGYYEKLLFQDLRVKNGPFQGMKYPEIDSVGSSIYPKLLGCYEKELWNTIEDLRSNGYTEIINIGCGEGYYAVGLGIIVKHAKVYAYDTSEKARISCAKMAMLNEVADKIVVKSECTPEELASFPFTGKGLIICDCEGFEKELFNKNNVRNLINCDLIIETHDFIDINISTYIKGIFNETHDCYSIKSVDDIEKAITYQLPELEKLTLPEKKQVLAEGRPAIMEWLIYKSKT